MTTKEDGINRENFGLFLKYLDGPTATMDGLNFKVSFMKADNPIGKKLSKTIDNATLKRGSGTG